MAWQSDTINPATTSPAADITKITNDLQVLREVVGGSTDTDVPFRLSAIYQSGAGAISIGSDTLVAAKRGSTGFTPGLQNLGTSTAASSGVFGRFVDDALGPMHVLAKSRGASIGGTTTVQSGDELGVLSFQGYGGGELLEGARITAYVDNTPGASDMPTRLSFATSANGSSVPSEALRLDETGAAFFPRIGTTASAANAFLNSGTSPANQLLRSTSSLRYKTDVRDLPASVADAVLTLRPVAYKSNAPADDKTVDWYGLIAEEVAAVDPRLVHYIDQGDGKGPVPDGVQYDRIAVLLLSVVRAQQATINDLAARVAALEA